MIKKNLIIDLTIAIILGILYKYNINFKTLFNISIINFWLGLLTLCLSDKDDKLCYFSITTLIKYIIKFIKNINNYSKGKRKYD